MKKIQAIFIASLVLLVSCAPKLIPLNELKPETLQFVIHNPSKIQYFISDETDLVADTAASEVSIDKKGVIAEKSDLSHDEVIFKEFTPGVCLGADSTPPNFFQNKAFGAKFDIAFGKGSETLSFQSQLVQKGGEKIQTGPFQLIQVGKGKVQYGTADSLRTYRLVSGAIPQLMVSKKQVSSLKKNVEIAPGRKVNGK